MYPLENVLTLSYIRAWVNNAYIIIAYQQFNALRPRRNDRHIPDDIFKCIFLMKMHEFRFKFHWSLLTMCQHWFRLWLCTEQATSHYLNQWWPRLPMHICVTLPQWVNVMNAQHFSSRADITNTNVNSVDCGKYKLMGSRGIFWGANIKTILSQQLCRIISCSAKCNHNSQNILCKGKWKLLFCISVCYI